MNGIILKQNAVIQHDLLNVGKMVDERLADLNIENLVATDDTIKAMKTLRADLNKEFKDFEEQRKTIKTLVSKPYDDLEEVYKEQVSEKYNNALNTLKSKIDEHEIKLKLEKQGVVQEYFKECVELSGIDFVKFENVGLNINLSTSIKKYNEQIDAFFAKVNDDINLIETQEHQAEILVEYKKDLNVSRAINEVMQRKALEKIEKEKQLQDEKQRRHKSLLSIGFQVADFESAYVHHTHKDLIMSFEDAKTRSSIEFDAMIIDFERQIKLKTQVVEPVKVESTVSQEQNKPEPQILTAKFWVKGTFEELTALQNFIKENNLEHGNL